MIRTQILLTEELNSTIKNIAEKQGLSQSMVVRQLLTHSLGFDKTIQKHDSTLNLYDLDSYLQKNQRIDGFKELYSVGAKTVEIKIIDDDIFRYYLKTRKFDINFEFDLENSISLLITDSITKSLSVRRAYIVPGIENPPGPRFIGIKPEDVLEAIKNIYKFAIENNYHKYEGSKIVIFLHPFMDPEPIQYPVKHDALLPYGGNAVPLNKEASKVEIFAVWGNNEGVQSLDSIDRYIVNTDRMIILRKEIPQKNLMICTTKKSQSEVIQVPLDKQFDQVLSDGEVLETARVVKELSKRYGLRRIEFSFNGKDGIFFNESANYEVKELKFQNISKNGIIQTISTNKDVENLKNLHKVISDKTFLYIDKKIIEERSYDLLNSIAGLKKKFIVLYPGLSATAHAMRVLNDFGHTAIVVGNKLFTNGQKINIKINENGISIKELGKNDHKNFITPLFDAKLYGIDVVGGKATNLSILKASGYNVPHGWVLTTKYYDKHWSKVENILKLSNNKKYAIRSSANVEDNIEHSFAGQFISYLNIKKSDVRLHIKMVQDCINSKHIALYLKALEQDHKHSSIKMAVVIQEMIDSDKSGVVFGRDIQTGNNDLLVIDVTMGTAEGVVDGSKETQRITYSREKNKIVKNSKSKEKYYLNKIEIEAIIEMSRSIEHLMGKTQDIEWSIDKSGVLWIIQTRDL